MYKNKFFCPILNVYFMFSELENSLCISAQVQQLQLSVGWTVFHFSFRNKHFTPYIEFGLLLDLH